eukprot:scaffold226904_cov37-Attheya_sp.AAC.1
MSCTSYFVARWACTRSSTNTGSIQFTLDVILVLFLTMVVRVINGLWLFDSRFSEDRVGLVAGVFALG